MNKKEKRVFKWCFILMSFVSALSIVADICFHLKNDVIISFAAILLPCVITIAGFMITVYILFLQIYKDRYSLDDMQSKHFPDAGKLLMLVVHNILFGSIILCIGEGLVSFIWFVLISLISIIAIMISIIKSKKTLMLNPYVETISVDIKAALKSTDGIISEKTLLNIRNILDECATKEEYHTVGVIVEKTGEIFRTFLKSNIAEHDKSNKELRFETFESIVQLNIFELNLCKSIKSEELVKKIVRQQRKNLCFCVDNLQISWYEKYFDEYLKCLYKSLDEDNSQMIKLIYKSFTKIMVCLYENGQQMPAESTLSKIADVNDSFAVINKSGNYKSYIGFLIGAVHYAIEEKNNDLRRIAVEKMFDFSIILSKQNLIFDDLVEYYKIFFDQLLEFDYQEGIDLFKKLSDIFSYNYTHNTCYLEYSMFCLNRLTDNDKEYKNHRDELLSYHINVLYQIGKAKEKYRGYLFYPDFKSLLIEVQYDKDKVEDTTNHIKTILNQTILCDNISMFYQFLQEINDILVNTESRQVAIQENVFSLYIWLINRTRQLINKQFLELAFFNIKDVIDKLDSRKQISQSFGVYIIDNLHGCCKTNAFKNGDVSVEIVELLHSFLGEDDAKYFVVTKSDVKKLLYKTLFNIGTSCIENGFEEGIRSVSNSLGWLTIYSFKMGDSNLTKYLIEIVVELYSIACQMRVSHQTRMFMLTLFPTVGAFCCKSSKYNLFCDSLINGIKFEELENVETAVRLRTSENDMWNTLYEGRTNELTEKFMNKYRTKVQSKQ